MPKSYQWEGQPGKPENSSQTIGEDGSKPNLNPNPNRNLRITLSLTLKRETKERNLEKGKKKRQPSGFELPNSQTNSSACDNPTNRAKWRLVTNQLVSLPFIAQHVIDKKLVLSLTRLSFPLVRFRLNPAQS